MDEQSHIVLIPRMPQTFVLDVVFGSSKGIAVRATDAEVQALKDEGIPVATLYASSQEYQTAVFNLSKEQAIALMDSKQSEAIAALDPGDRDKFSVA